MTPVGARRPSARATLPTKAPDAPSLLRYAPAFVIFAIAIADTARLADPDLWGHVAFGRLFLHAGPAGHDPYNYSSPGHVWAEHEWLSEVLMALAFNAGGVVGLKLLKLLCSAITVVMIAAAEAETGAPIPIQFAVLIASAFALAPQMQFRPQLFTFAFLATLIALLARDNYRRRAQLWLAVPLFALWANLHGGFFVGIVAMGVYSGVVTAADQASGHGLRRGMRLIAITTADATTTLLTPYGTGVWRTVINELRNPLTRKVIADWRPLLAVISGQLHQPHSGIAFTLVVVGIIAVLAVSVAMSPRGGDWALVAVAAVMAIAAFVAVRNMALAVISAAAPLARHLALIASSIRTQTRSDPNRSALTTPHAQQGFFIGGQILIVMLAIVLAAESGLFSDELRAASNCPVGAVAFMRTHQLRGDVLTTFEWGQYIIWKTAPGSKVFIDARFDLAYPISIIKEYIDFIDDAPGGARLLDRYPHDYVLMPTGSLAYETMIARSDWRLIYRDPVAALFARANSPAAHLPGVPFKAAAPPSTFP
jgi:hypothetical protein